MSAASAARRGQAAALRRGDMSLTLTAYSPAGTTTNADGDQIPAYANEGTIRGYVPRARKGNRETRYILIGGVERPVRSEGLGLPSGAFIDPVTERMRIVAAEQRGVGWEFVVDDVGATDNPALRAVRFLVVGISLNSLTACRLDVVEV